MNGHLYNLMLAIHLIKTVIELAIDVTEIVTRMRNRNGELKVIDDDAAL